MIGWKLQRSSCPLPEVPKKTVVAVVPMIRFVALHQPAMPQPSKPLFALPWYAAVVVVAGLLAIGTAGRVAAAEQLPEQDKRSYAVFDALFLQRNNAAVDRAVVVDTSSGTATTAIAAGDPTSTIGTGARLLYGNYGAEDIGWEVGYLGVYGVSAVSQATSAGAGLQAPGNVFSTQTGLNSGVSAKVTDNASVNSVECNLVFHNYDGGFNRRSGRPWQRVDWYDGGHVDWIGGFRWANLEDAAVLGITPQGQAASSSYSVNTSSNLFAAQVGTRGRLAFEQWAVEGWMKIGIAGTAISQSQSMSDAFSATPFRKPRSSNTAGMGMIADMNLSAIYRIDDVWGFRVGYNLMWLTGVGLAPDQWDFSPSQAGGTGINSTGSLFLSGANLGLEARF